MSPLLFLLIVILVVLAFEYINGFHDAANAIATVVSTKVLTPRQALMLAAMTNLIGALYGQAVAKTIGSGIVDTAHVTTMVVFCAMLGGIVWNLITWWFGIPSSSSHAMIGGLCGATLAAANAKGGWNWQVLLWSVDKVDSKTGKIVHDGIFHKVVIPMITSPALGIVIGFLLMGLIFLLIRSWRPYWVNAIFSKLQIVSAAYMGFGHGTADAQKTMGIIALTLVASTKAGELSGLPEWLGWLRIEKMDKDTAIPLWIVLTCAVVMAAGTWAGGWRIIKTLGHKMVKMKPVHGFAAETTAASILVATGALGMPVSTTHTISTSIMGVGAAKRLGSVKWTLVERIVWAWVLTIPVTAAIGYAAFWLFG